MGDTEAAGDPVGAVIRCRRHPVKSMQGLDVERLAVRSDRVAGDRAWGVVAADGTLVSAKQRAELLQASADDEAMVLPDGRRVEFSDDDVDQVLSDWLSLDVTLARPVSGASANYRMTFDPPNDAAELVEIPTPAGSFVDVAPVHLVTTATLEGCRRARPDLDWDIRRFRPNLVLDGAGAPFLEDRWAGRRLAVGAEVVLRVDQPTVRCAMPLRAQPGLEREVGLYQAMTELNGPFPNHLGAYVSVVEPGTIAVGDEARLLP
jgi:uncharacterized protein YcbX